MRRALLPLTSVLGVLLLLPAPAGALAAAPVSAGEQPETTKEKEQQAAAAGEEKEPGEEDEAAEEEPADVAPDAHRDPVIGKFLKRRVLIERPRFSLETRGKLQVQYYDADSDDPENEDDTFLRRLRPFFLGRIANKNWTWKVEVELSADIEAGEIDFDQLDIRDWYLRYEGFRARAWRLTLGNQKAPFSRDFLTPSTHQLLVERTFTGDTSGGVPDRTLGLHFRGESRSRKVAYWGSVGAAGHDPDSSRLKFDSLVGGSGSLNEGLLVSGRVDFHPRGGMTFFDGDLHTPGFKYTWSLAGYVWENDGSTNRFTEGGVSLDPERADLDSAVGLELSGGLRGRGVTLDWQCNHIRGKTVVAGFTGGIYVGGETDLDVAALEGGYWFQDTPFELGAALARLDTDGYAEAWESATLALNLHGWRWVSWFGGKLQISHEWIFSRKGVPGDDFRQSRVQFQYVW